MLFFFTWLFSPRDIFYIVFFFLPYLPFSLCLFSTLFFCLLTWFLASFSFLSHALLFHQMFIWHCVSSGSKAENKTDRNPWLHKTYFNELDSKPTWWAAVYGVAQSRTWLKQLSSSSLSLNLVIYLNQKSYQLTDIDLSASGGSPTYWLLDLYFK